MHGILVNVARIRETVPRDSQRLGMAIIKQVKKRGLDTTRRERRERGSSTVCPLSHS